MSGKISHYRVNFDISKAFSHNTIDCEAFLTYIPQESNLKFIPLQFSAKAESCQINGFKSFVMQGQSTEMEELDKQKNYESWQTYVEENSEFCKKGNCLIQIPNNVDCVANVPLLIEIKYWIQIDQGFFKNDHLIYNNTQFGECKHWIPCLDTIENRATFEFYFNCPAQWKVICSGEPNGYNKFNFNQHSLSLNFIGFCFINRPFYSSPSMSNGKIAFQAHSETDYGFLLQEFEFINNIFVNQDAANKVESFLNTDFSFDNFQFVFVENLPKHFYYQFSNLIILSCENLVRDDLVEEVMEGIPKFVEMFCYCFVTSYLPLKSANDVWIWRALSHYIMCLCTEHIIGRTTLDLFHLDFIEQLASLKGEKPILNKEFYVQEEEYFTEAHDIRCKVFIRCLENRLGRKLMRENILIPIMNSGDSKKIFCSESFREIYLKSVNRPNLEDSYFWLEAVSRAHFYDLQINYKLDKKTVPDEKKTYIHNIKYLATSNIPWEDRKKECTIKSFIKEKEKFMTQYQTLSSQINDNKNSIGKDFVCSSSVVRNRKRKLLTAEQVDSLSLSEMLIRENYNPLCFMEFDANGTFFGSMKVHCDFLFAMEQLKDARTIKSQMESLSSLLIWVNKNSAKKNYYNGDNNKKDPNNLTELQVIHHVLKYILDSSLHHWRIKCKVVEIVAACANKESIFYEFLLEFYEKTNEKNYSKYLNLQNLDDLNNQAQKLLQHYLLNNEIIKQLSLIRDVNGYTPILILDFLITIVSETMDWNTFNFFNQKRKISIIFNAFGNTKYPDSQDGKECAMAFVHFAKRAMRTEIVLAKDKNRIIAGAVIDCIIKWKKNNNLCDTFYSIEELFHMIPNASFQLIVWKSYLLLIDSEIEIWPEMFNLLNLEKYKNLLPFMLQSLHNGLLDKTVSVSSFRKCNQFNLKFLDFIWNKMNAETNQYSLYSIAGKIYKSLWAENRNKKVMLQ